MTNLHPPIPSDPGRGAGRAHAPDQDTEEGPAGHWGDIRGGDDDGGGATDGPADHGEWKIRH
jgi:hypothetical protein